MAATTPGPNRRQRRLAARKRRGEQPMSREPVSKEEAIDNLRKEIDPEQYLESLKKMRADYLARAAELLGNHDLNKADARIDERDVDMMNIQVDEALVSLNWRVETIDERIADFEATKKDVTRPFERQPADPEDATQPPEDFPEETGVEESALEASLTDEQLEAEALENAVVPPESIDELAARRAEVENGADPTVEQEVLPPEDES